MVKAKLDLNRVAMPKQAAEERRQNFAEVAPGLFGRGRHPRGRPLHRLQSKNCVAGCPVAIDIPEFVAAVKSGDFAAADRIIKRTNALPGHLRPGLPAGKPVRGGLHPGQEERAGGHRPPGAFRRRLGAEQSRRGRRDPDAPADR